MKAKKLWSVLLAATMVSVGFSTVGNISIVQAATVAQIPNTVRTIENYNKGFLSLTGFALSGGQMKDRSQYVNTAYHREVGTAREFLQAIRDAQNGSVKVIEITEDLDLGWKSLGLSASEMTQYNMITKYEEPTNGYTNPSIAASGVSKINITNTDGLTIFSKEGCTLKHVEFKLQASSSDLVLRNLKFDEMWQWDDTGMHKEVGWTFIKVNGANNVWIDHCTFTNAADGLIDFENGSAGVTMSWCKIGLEADENPSSDSAIYKSINYMEDQYKAGKLASTSRYYKLRKAGASKSQIMAYTAYHSKCHLVGSGDKDYVNYVYSNGTEVLDGNQRLQLTLAYNHYQNIGQRIPMIRQGVGHLINCYIDNSSHMAYENLSVFAQNGGYGLSRGQNARNGASIAADTCIYEGVYSPMIGAEQQGDDTLNMNAPWNTLFANAYNHSLIVNSKVTNNNGTYTGSSWDNNGDNLFTKEFTWHDKSTIGKWAWSSSINGVENMSKSNPPSTPFSFTYDYKGVLPYTYKAMPLDQVTSVVPTYSGAGKLDMTAAEWLKIDYKETTTVPDSGEKVGANIEEGTYMIKNVNSGLYLDVAGGKAANGTNVQQWGATTAESYNTWKVVSAGNGYYYLYSQVGDGSYLLDLADNKKDSGTNIRIWQNTNSNAQLFKFYSVGNDKYGILTKTTTDNSCLDVYNGEKSSGANVQQWGYCGNNNQLWTLEKVTLADNGGNNSGSNNDDNNNDDNNNGGTDAPVTGDLSVNVSGGSSTVSNTITPSFTLSSSEATYDLSKLKICYYYTAEGNSNQTVWVDTSAIKYNCDPWYLNILSETTAQVKKMASSKTGADSYIEITFSSDQVINTSATLELGMRVAKADWSNYDQSDDYSYNDGSKVVVYYDGQIINGMEP